MKESILKLKTRLEKNISEVESKHDCVHIFLTQIKIINDNVLKNYRIKQWLYDNRYTITFFEEMLDEIEQKKQSKCSQN